MKLNVDWKCIDTIFFVIAVATYNYYKYILMEAKFQFCSFSSNIMIHCKPEVIVTGKYSSTPEFACFGKSVALFLSISTFSISDLNFHYIPISELSFNCH